MMHAGGLVHHHHPYPADLIIIKVPMQPTHRLISVTSGAPMTTWIVKSETDDPQLALEMVEYQRNRAYTAWIEDEKGRAVDEEALKQGKAEQIKPPLKERGIGILVVLAGVGAGIGTLYALSWWVDH